MQDNKRTGLMTAVLCLFLLLALLFVAVVGYFSFEQSYRELRQQYDALLTGQVVSEMENAIQYGKRIDRYYGVEGLFDRARRLLDGRYGMAITDREGALLYAAAGPADGRSMAALAASPDVKRAVRQEGGGYRLARQGTSEVLLQPINGADGQRAGFFLLAYPRSVDDAALAPVRRDTLRLTLGCVLAALILLLSGMALCRRKRVRLERAASLYAGVFAKLEQALPAAIILFCIACQALLSFALYNQAFQGYLAQSAQGIVRYMQQAAQSVRDKGANFAQMEGLSAYMAQKVEQAPVLWNLRLTQVLSDSDQVLEKQPQLEAVWPLDGEEGLKVQAQISSSYLRRKMGELFLVYLASLLFCTVIVLELLRIPKMLERKNVPADAPTPADYERVTLGVRLASFLRCTGSYLFLPYSALLIRQWNLGAFGLSVGVTAALPLSMQSVGQVLGMLLFPRLIRRPNRGARALLILSTAAMIAVNLLSFFTHSALALILYRFAGGVAYAAMLHVGNLLLSHGYESEERRQVNLAQNNAGLMGGIMCGAGLGAIIASLAGYAATYLFSAAVFALFALLMLWVMPWRMLDRAGGAVQGRKPQPLSASVRALLSPKALSYFLLVILPFNFALLFVVTLVPALAGSGGPILLSYCYIVNGLAGFYLGPKLVARLTPHLGARNCIALTLLLGAAALFVLRMEPLPAMLLLSSLLLGLFDGFGTPTATDGFLNLAPVRLSLEEPTALALYAVLGDFVMTVAPLAVELLLLPPSGAFHPLQWGAAAYAACAALVFFALASRGRTKGLTKAG